MLNLRHPDRGVFGSLNIGRTKNSVLDSWFTQPLVVLCSKRNNVKNAEEINRQKIKEDTAELAELIYDIFIESKFSSTVNQEKVEVATNV